METLIDWNHPNLWKSAAVIALVPFSWTIAARTEYKYHWITKLCGGAYRGCYFLAFLIVLGSSYRYVTFMEALNSQPTWQLLDSEAISWIGRAIYALGLLFTGSSFYRLKITGTYLGDYFGILMDEKIEGFPFNVLENPMYMGGTMMFVGDAIMHKSFAGLVLSFYLWIVYIILIQFEGQKDKKK